MKKKRVNPSQQLSAVKSDMYTIFDHGVLNYDSQDGHIRRCKLKFNKRPTVRGRSLNARKSGYGYVGLDVRVGGIRLGLKDFESRIKPHRPEYRSGGGFLVKCVANHVYASLESFGLL